METDRRLTANPFVSATALEQSNYCRHDGTRLVRVATGAPPSHLTTFVHDSVLALAFNPQFTCVGAKSALRRRAYGFGLYSELGSAACVAGLAHDLFCFVADAGTLNGEFSTFIASFEGPATSSEQSFEALLWTTLQQLHDLDAAHHEWADGVSADPADAHFSFSFAASAFFVVGLHAASSRVTRRCAWPTLVFNPRQQFDTLRATSRYERFREVIRDAERSLQGDVNPMLADFGERSEAAQYSGRQVGREWRCPFHARRPPTESNPT
jgi:FPC/CPF motif-containing protein YcgG